jgi:hypothetical protein
MPDSVKLAASDTAPDPSRANLLEATRVRIEAQARRDGYVEPAEWEALTARLTALGCSHTDLANLRAELAHSAAAHHWVFAAEPSPTDRPRAMEVLVEKARSHSGRVPVVTQGFLSALLYLAGHWGLPHDVVAQEIAACSVAEHWSVDWELACGMEGLLGAEQAAERRRTARERAVARLERRGRTGWMSTRDLNTMYATIRKCGLLEAAAGAVRRWTHGRLDDEYVSRWRRPAQSALRVAPPTMALMVILNTLHPSTASPPLAGPAPAAVVTPFIPLTTAAVQPASAPRPVVLQPLTLVVAHTDGVGARLRTAPVTGPVARLLGEGTAVVEIGSELDVDGAGWRQVRAPDGTSGWMAADLLQPDEALPN